MRHKITLKRRTQQPLQSQELWEYVWVGCTCLWRLCGLWICVYVCVVLCVLVCMHIAYVWHRNCTKYVQNIFAALSLLWLIFCVACVVEIVDWSNLYRLLCPFVRMYVSQVRQLAKRLSLHGALYAYILVISVFSLFLSLWVCFSIYIKSITYWHECKRLFLCVI